jgi:cytochrome oxidase assembly protein ShyY1
MSRYRFARRPLWIVSHVVVLALVVFMIWAGFWQLRRFHERGDLNRLYAERRQSAPTDVADAVPADAPLEGDAVEDALYRRVTATGTYDVDNEVLVRNRTEDGRPGVWVLTPLITADGTALVVNRGFIPASGTPDELPREAAAPAGEVSVTGLLQRTQTRGRFQPSDPATGRLDVLSRVDLARYQQQLRYDVFPVWLLLQRQAPPQSGAVPIPVEPPQPFSETQNLSYAIQWFSFTVIALVGYPIILRRTARSVARSERRRYTSGDAEPSLVASGLDGRRADGTT